MNHLFCFGLGYSAKALAQRLNLDGWRITGTSRSADGAARLREMGFEPIVFDGDRPSAEISACLAKATHVLSSVSPDENGDAVLRQHGADLAAARQIRWIGYLSTIGVYGNHNGAWVDENTVLDPTSARSRHRAAAEKSWLDLGASTGLAVHIFRLAGIYGPGRNPLEKLRRGTAQRIIKPGQVFNRIHVADIAEALARSIARPRAGAIYNVTDNEPAPPQDVLAFGAELLGIPPPPEIAYEAAGMTPMARSFYRDNKRVRNTLIHRELGVELTYPSYREGLAALLAG